MPDVIGAVLCMVHPEWCAPPSGAPQPPVPPADIALLVGKIRQAESEADALQTEAFHSAGKLVDLLIADKQLELALRLVRELQRIAPAGSFEDLAALYRQEAQIYELAKRAAPAAAAARVAESIAASEKLRQKLQQARSGNP